jgi:hypothetical protein
MEYPNALDLRQVGPGTQPIIEKPKFDLLEDIFAVIDSSKCRVEFGKLASICPKSKSDCYIFKDFTFFDINTQSKVWKTLEIEIQHVLLVHKDNINKCPKTQIIIPTGSQYFYDSEITENYIPIPLVYHVNIQIPNGHSDKIKDYGLWACFLFLSRLYRGFYENQVSIGKLQIYEPSPFEDLAYSLQSHMRLEDIFNTCFDYIVCQYMNPKKGFRLGILENETLFIKTSRWRYGGDCRTPIVSSDSNIDKKNLANF